ncbi:MAG: hypoxanthine phosphoribosyltransferase [Clostridiales bacterium]|nr:hypoxanthine phosphoribosyltransferase [Clostridiales bacterium]
MNSDIESILISEKELDDIVTNIADQISRDYAGKRLLLLCILKGSVVFMGDLMKKVKIPVEIDFMKVSSYGAATESNPNIKPKIGLDISRNDLSELDILIVEDIIDSGRTLDYLTGYLKHKGAKSVKIATVLDKPERRDPRITLTPDYCGKTIPDKFVVGYGLDYNEKYRALPYIGILSPEAIAKK